MKILLILLLSCFGLSAQQMTYLSLWNGKSVSNQWLYLGSHITITPGSPYSTLDVSWPPLSVTPLSSSQVQDIISASPVSGDVSGTLVKFSVTALQGRSISSSLPVANQFLGWNTSTSKWEPKTVPVTKRDVLLSYDSTQGGWIVPDTSFQNLGLYVNGLRVHSGSNGDFTINGSLVKLSNGLPNYLVTADYDVQQ